MRDQGLERFNRWNFHLEQFFDLDGVLRSQDVKCSVDFLQEFDSYDTRQGYFRVEHGRTGQIDCEGDPASYQGVHGDFCCCHFGENTVLGGTSYF